MGDPVPALTIRDKAAIRAARAARTVDLGRVGDSVGMIRPELQQALGGTAARGVCDAAMRRLMTMSEYGGLVLTQRAVWVPAAVRALQPVAPTAARWLHGDVGCCTASVAVVWSHNAASHGLAAASPRCPPGLLARLVQGDGSAAATRAVSNPSCPVVLLRRSAWDQRSYLRAAAAANPCCPPEVLTHLAADTDVGVRVAVAANPGCVPGDLVGLATDASTHCALICGREPRLRPRPARTTGHRSTTGGAFLCCPQLGLSTRHADEARR